jgi:tRNA-specific 2-thiouridylase
MGICFVGKVGIKEFLSQYVETTEGKIIDQHGKVIGTHDGAIFYTIGQRHGLDVGGGLPYYVTGKSMDKNEVYVTSDIADENLWTSTLKLTALHWIDTVAEGGSEVLVRTRHRAPLLPAILEETEDGAVLKLHEQVRAATPGQSAVLYRENECLGGGILV